jgi:protein-S-isoprenylcysteine O-methyltransferase Ste14
MNQTLQERAANTPVPEESPEMNGKEPFDLPAFAYNHRGTLVAIPLVAAIFCTWRQTEATTAIWAAAGITFMVGLFIRIWAQQYLHFRLRMNMMLTTGGPYTLMRNPIYIGNTLICLGVTIASMTLWMVPVSLVACMIAYKFVVQYEERYLTARYGDPYVAYTKQVPRWVPNFRNGFKNLWAPHYLGPSIKTELYNFLFLVPAILKAYLVK